MKTALLKLNKWQVNKRNVKVKPEEVLVLAPRCLQNHTCKQDLITDVHNCKKCGLCPTMDILELCDQYGVEMRFATGGGMAVKLCKQPHIKAIVAIACAKELCMGIMFTMPKAVFAVENVTPNGPCLDTGVNVDNVRQVLDNIIIKQK